MYWDTDRVRLKSVCAATKTSQRREALEKKSMYRRLTFQAANNKSAYPIARIQFQCYNRGRLFFMGQFHQTNFVILMLRN